LLAAMGHADGAAPTIYLVGMAVLNLLADLAADGAVVAMADDAQWLDGPSAEVLAFVGRRLEADPILLLVGIRSGFQSPLLAAGLPEPVVEGLDPAASRRLLDTRAPHLPAAVRRRVIAEAAGNPLALVELPAAIRSAKSRASDSIDGLPLTGRSAVARRSAMPGTATRSSSIAGAVTARRSPMRWRAVSRSG
jgi:hypothetical protein